MTDASVTWNDERVEQLKKLWAEGKSASQIAAEIGGVSRNAVIGKVHRLGLSGRPKAGGSSKPRKGGADMARGSDGTGQADHPRAAGAQSQSHGDPVASESQGRDHAGAPAASRPGTGGVSSRRAATPAAEAGAADPATPRSAAKGPTVQADIDAGSGGISTQVPAGTACARIWRGLA